MRRSTARPEDALQEAVVSLLRRRGVQYYAIANEGKRKPKTAAQMKRRGFRTGIPDLVLLFPGGRSAYWELKVDKKVPSPNQLGWLAWLEQHGFPAVVIRSLADAETALNGYMVRAAA